MRRSVDEELIRSFFRELGAEAREESRVYATGGVTAVLYAWRDTTVALDLKIAPEQDSLFRVISRLKESLGVNVELASPADFIPEVPGWETRSKFITREGRLSFYHYDFYSQALSKIQHGHVKDMEDVRQMLQRELITASKAMELFESIEDNLYRFPAIDPPTFRRRVEATFSA